MLRTEKAFLTAEWRDLLLLNYEIAPDFLRGFVPRGTELDSFNGKTYVSLVGFRFCKTRYLGRFPIPFHSDFKEINLRFYVRRKVTGEIRRGVVFIAEIVPKLAVAKTARWLYGENYACRRMKVSWIENAQGKTVGYGWEGGSGWCGLKARIEGEPSLPAEGSVQQFITEHYWGYSRQKPSRSLEYRVAHVPWKVWAASHAEFSGNSSDLYGEAIARILSRPPDSAFVAQGSEVSVFRGNTIP